MRMCVFCEKKLFLITPDDKLNPVYLNRAKLTTTYLFTSIKVDMERFTFKFETSLALFTPNFIL